MKKLKVQEYLEENSLSKLKEEFGINYKIYPTYPRHNLNKFIGLCYDQLESKPGEIVNECRGLILETKANESGVEEKKPIVTRVVAYPFYRFYNEGQPGASNLDIESSKFFIKIDGTLCILAWSPSANVYDHDGWFVSTKNVVYADQPLYDENFDTDTFSEMFWSVFFEKYDVYKDLDKTKTYMFELVGQRNRVVVNYEEDDIYLLGIRNSSLEEEDITEQKTFKIPHYYSFNNLTDVIELVNSKNPLEFEGVVAVDKNFNRLKIKNAAYTAYNRLKDRASSSSKNLLELILLEKDDDVAVILNESQRDKMRKIKDNLLSLAHQLDKFLKENKEVENRKEFAVLVQQKEMWLAPLMVMWHKNISFMDWVKSNIKNGEYQDSFLKSLLEQMKKND